jgi:hypothetical protein
LGGQALEGLLPFKPGEKITYKIRRKSLKICGPVIHATKADTMGHCCKGTVQRVFKLEIKM